MVRYKFRIFCCLFFCFFFLFRLHTIQHGQSFAMAKFFVTKIAFDGEKQNIYYHRILLLFFAGRESRKVVDARYPRPNECDVLTSFTPFYRFKIIKSFTRWTIFCTHSISFHSARISASECERHVGVCC